MIKQKQQKQSVNHLLYPEQLEALVKFMFVDKPVSVLRVIARTGKYRRSAPWVYLVNNNTLERRSTFLAIDDVMRFFWQWLEQIKTMFLSLNERTPINKVIWNIIQVGQEIRHPTYGWVKITGKGFDRKWLPKFFITVDNDLVKLEPLAVEIF